MSARVMIDWITGQVEATSDGDGVSRYPKLFDTGRFMKIAATGEIESEFAGRLVSEGSHDSALSFRAPYAHILELSGNPVKFLQGHNLFGSGDRLGLFMSAGCASAQFSGLNEGGNTNRFPCPDMWSDYEFLTPRFTRLDLTRSYRFESNAAAREWIRSCASSARTKHKAGLSKQGTVYFGQKSTRWAFKIYAKADEINSGLKGHRISDKVSRKDVTLLTQWAEGVVRFELTLRSPEIKKLPYNFSNEEVWQNYFDRISFNKNQELHKIDDLEKFTDESGEPMPGHLKMAVIAWRAGNDPRRIYSKNQYYRNLSALRRWGFDISVAFDAMAELRVSSELDPSRWDPEPIKELMFDPASDLLHDFGL